MLLSGMSTTVVMPPAAAARVARLEALPLGAPGLVDVDVGVDHAGHQGEVAEVGDGEALGHRVGVGDGHDLTAPDVHRRGTNALRRHHTTGTEDEVGLHGRAFYTEGLNTGGGFS
jgi:hypothetical protein